MDEVFELESDMNGKRRRKYERHDHLGNCTHGIVCDQRGLGNFCDVCHEHEQPRGDCEECPMCIACDKEPL